MRRKKVFYRELAYILGLIFLAMGAAMMERAAFGMSMVVAPAYILHIKVSQYIPFFSFGMAEYCLQAILLGLLAILMRRWKFSYLLSFFTAVLYGFILDAAIQIVGLLPSLLFWSRILFFITGMILSAIGVSMFFHTYIAPLAYELFVKELAGKYQKDIHVVKTVYDFSSCLAAILLSFLFFGFGHFEGVSWGTVICAFVNGSVIGMVSRFLKSKFIFQDKFPLAKYF